MNRAQIDELEAYMQSRTDRGPQGQPPYRLTAQQVVDALQSGVEVHAEPYVRHAAPAPVKPMVGDGWAAGTGVVVDSCPWCAAGPHAYVGATLDAVTTKCCTQPMLLGCRS